MVALISEKLELLQAEGLSQDWAHMDMVCAGTRCCVEGDFDAAQAWLRRAITASRTILGSDSKTVYDLERILRQG